MYKSNEVRETPRTGISEFYKGTNVFITGATGFLGKVLLEKLLRSCRGIRRVYVLMRPKKEMDVNERLQELLRSSVFQNLKEADSKCFDKIQPIYGDIGEAHLEISDSDRELLVDEINVVFHAAATVRFTENLKDVVLLNVLGTKRLAELCKQTRRLKGFVYVSTAFSNADKSDIEEIVYDPPYDPTSIIACVKVLPLEVLQEITPKLIVSSRCNRNQFKNTCTNLFKGKHPNTYTFSKALAESVVLEYSSYFPAAIVRPCVVAAAWKEPYPGWVDSLGAITGLTVQAALGINSYFKVKDEVCAELIPVDVVVNTIITAAWHSETCRSNKLRTYNCVSNEINETTCNEIGKLIKKYIREYPTQYAVRYPSYKPIINEIQYGICNALFNFLPFLIYDTALYCTGKKPKMMRLWKKATTFSEAAAFATLQQLNLHTLTFRRLIEAVRKAEDGQEFDIDISSLNGFSWDDYMKTNVLGIRKYIFKENLSDLHLAKTNLSRVYWRGKLFQILCYLVVFFAIAVKLW